MSKCFYLSLWKMKVEVRCSNLFHFSNFSIDMHNEFIWNQVHAAFMQILINWLFAWLGKMALFFPFFFVITTILMQ